jgi:hypothetical protein
VYRAVDFAHSVHLDEQGNILAGNGNLDDLASLAAYVCRIASLIGRHGDLLGRDVTAACGSDVLKLVGGRLQQLANAFASAQIGGPFESTTLYFPQYKLHIRALGNVLIVAVVSADVNLTAHKMAMTMLGRQLLTDLAASKRNTAASVPVTTARESRSSVPPPPPAARDSRTSVPPPPPPARSSRVSEPPSATHEKLRPSQESPRANARESGVPPRSYRGTRIAN